MDQDSTFMSSLMTYFLNKFNIRIRTVAPYIPQSLQAENGIKSLSTILTKHLTNLDQMWPKYLPLAMFACNMFNTPNLGNYSPYELILVENLDHYSTEIQTLISRFQGHVQNIMSY